jgi:hypothetical protein
LLETAENEHQSLVLVPTWPFFSSQTSLTIETIKKLPLSNRMGDNRSMTINPGKSFWQKEGEKGSFCHLLNAQVTTPGVLNGLNSSAQRPADTLLSGECDHNTKH